MNGRNGAAIRKIVQHRGTLRNRPSGRQSAGLPARSPPAPRPWRFRHAASKSRRSLEDSRSLNVLPARNQGCADADRPLPARGMVGMRRWPALYPVRRESAMDIDDGIEPTLSELLDDPLIRALMKSDGVDRASLEALLAR